MQVKNLKVYSDGSVKAIFDLHFPQWGTLTIRGFRLIETEKGSFVSFPAEQYVDREGKTKYKAHAVFEDKDMYVRFQNSIKKLVKEEMEKVHA